LNSTQHNAEAAAEHFTMRDALDVQCGYALFLLRLPENDLHTNGWIGKDLRDMAAAFLSSDEFGFAIAPKLSAAPGSQPTFGIVSGEVSLLFRHAMKRFCGLDPATTLTGMSGWRWALFWLFTQPQMRDLGNQISFATGSLAQALCAQVTWDVYGTLQDDDITSPRLSGTDNGAPERGAVSRIDSFGIEGQCQVQANGSSTGVVATLYDQRLWPVFCERETARLNLVPAQRFVVLFDHPLTGDSLHRAIEGEIRAQRRVPHTSLRDALEIVIGSASSFEPFDALGTVTCSEEAQSLDFWATLADIDLDVDAGLSRDARASAKTHWSNTTELAKLIAFYLPQFYPFAENNQAWGEGFSEWTNVVAAKKLFPNHASPLIPADLGFYDQRTKEVRARQAELALQYGIHGFCYYFYWFSGRQVMADVTQRMLRDGQPSLPFCLCWANENWSRRWDGSDDEIIIEQTHDAQRDAAIMDDLARFFDDPRYIRIDGAPLFLVYHLSLMPEPAQFILNLRNRARDLGFPRLMLAGVLSHGEPDPVAFGCDFGVQFPPHEMGKRKIDPKSLDAIPEFSGDIYDYVGAAEAALAQKRSSKVFPGVMPRWDNSARRGNKAHLFHGSTPRAFQSWLSTAIAQTMSENPQAPFVFINSWNEWAEGAVLEPDKAYGRAYLDAVRAAVTTPFLKDLGEGPEAEATAIIQENKFLGSWLTRHMPLLKSGSLRPGLPPACNHLPLRAGHKCQLDSVDGVEQSSLPAMPVGTSCVLAGWSIGDPHETSLYRYLVVEKVQSAQTWFLPCPVQTYVDLSSNGISQTEDQRAGFQIGFSSIGLNAGDYEISILDVTTAGYYKSQLVAKVVLT
jgi:Glycosyltransferase WbsX